MQNAITEDELLVAKLYSQLDIGVIEHSDEKKWMATRTDADASFDGAVDVIARIMFGIWCHNNANKVQQVPFKHLDFIRKYKL